MSKTLPILTLDNNDWMCVLLESFVVLQALSCLCTLAPLRIEDYTVCQGNTRLLILLEWCIRNGKCVLVK